MRIGQDSGRLDVAGDVGLHGIERVVDEAVELEAQGEGIELRDLRRRLGLAFRRDRRGRIGAQIQHMQRRLFVFLGEIFETFGAGLFAVGWNRHGRLAGAGLEKFRGAHPAAEIVQQDLPIKGLVAVKGQAQRADLRGLIVVPLALMPQRRDVGRAAADVGGDGGPMPRHQRRFRARLVPEAVLVLHEKQAADEAGTFRGHVDVVGDEAHADQFVFVAGLRIVAHDGDGIGEAHGDRQRVVPLACADFRNAEFAGGAGNADAGGCRRIGRRFNFGVRRNGANRALRRRCRGGFVFEHPALRTVFPVVGRLAFEREPAVGGIVDLSERFARQFRRRRFAGDAVPGFIDVVQKQGDHAQKQQHRQHGDGRIARVFPQLQTHVDEIPRPVKPESKRINRRVTREGKKFGENREKKRIIRG